MVGTAIALASLILPFLVAVVTITWQIRGRLDRIDNRLDKLEDLAGIERSR